MALQQNSYFALLENSQLALLEDEGKTARAKAVNVQKIKNVEEENQEGPIAVYYC